MRSPGSIITRFANYINNALTTMLVTGSVSHGHNYGVEPSSGVDVHLFLTPKTIASLSCLGLLTLILFFSRLL